MRRAFHCGAWGCVLLLAFACICCSGSDEDKQAPTEKVQKKAEAEEASAQDDESVARPPKKERKKTATPHRVNIKPGEKIYMGKRKPGREALQALPERLRSHSAGHEFSPVPKTGEEEMRRERMRKKNQ